MKKIIDKSLKILFFLFIGGILLFFSFKSIDFTSFIGGLKRVRYSWVILSLVFAIGGYASRAFRWKLLIDSMGYNVKYKNVFYAVVMGYFANFALPRIGEVTRCGTLNRTEKIPFNSLFGTVLIERVIDFFTLISLLLFVFVLKINFFGKFLKEDILFPIYNKGIIVFHTLDYLLITIPILVILFFTFHKIYKIYYRNKNLSNKVKGFIFGIVDGIKSVAYMKNKGQFISHTIFIWTMYFLMTYVVFFSIAPTYHLTALDGLFILVVGGLGMTAPVQGGFGAYHFIVSKAMLLYGISLQDGLLFATISHESQALLIVLLMCFSSLYFFINRVKTYRENR